MYYHSGSLPLNFIGAFGGNCSGRGAQSFAGTPSLGAAASAAARMAASALGMLTSVNSFTRKSAVASGVLGLWNR
jgi:hypothetical protein